MNNKENLDIPISREWEEYMVKASFSEAKAAESGLSWPERTEEEIRTYRANVRRDFECQLFVLQTPILVKTDEVKEIITIKDGDKVVRFYPPFPLNEGQETTGAFEDVSIPEGSGEVSRTGRIPSEAVTGARMEYGVGPDAAWCRGLRADAQAGAAVQNMIKLLLDQICQYTHQWWLRAPHNSFLGMKRFGAAVGNDFRLLETLRYHGAGKVDSTWYAAVLHQPNLGIGSPLSRGTWLLVSDHVSNKRPADGGILGFHDAFADYMAGRDEKCILNLCIAAEILISKHRMAVLRKPPNESLEKLIKTTPLVDNATKDDLTKLAIDRDHVAHGRPPYILTHNTAYTLERYIRAALKVLRAYLTSIPGGRWPDIMTMKVGRKRQ